MSTATGQGLSSISETLLITLYLRAMESQRPDALIKDERAVELVARMNYDFNRMRLLNLSEANKLVMILRSRQFDRYTRDFLTRHPDAVVLHIGCGLDSRFERIDNGQVEWYDLDLPDVIELRRTLIGGERERYYLLSGSVLDDSWVEALSSHQHKPFLFLAEGVFMYLEGQQAVSLIQTMHQHFPGAELAFDIYSPLHVWFNNLQTREFGFRTRWGIWQGKEIEGINRGIRQLGEWAYINEPDQRIAYLRWFRPVEQVFKTHRIYRFQLGEETRA